jgi:YHS domain-containing protein
MVAPLSRKNESKNSVLYESLDYEVRCREGSGMRYESKTIFISIYKGKKFYFCAAACKKAFELVLEKYIKSGAPPV